MRQGKSDALSDLALIESLLWSLWAPYDADPQGRAELVNDSAEDHLTNNDVIRARRAYDRLLTYVQQQAP